MGTKRNPGQFDCYANADPDEPMFILLGRDPLAPLLVRRWAELRQRDGEDPKKVGEACACADAMEAWRKRGLTIKHARSLLAEIDQIFTDAASWNDNSEARKNGAPPIDPDPDGQLRKIREGLVGVLAAENERITRP